MTNEVADKQQRLEALNPHGSYIVQAPAGSGKTTLLVQRYLTLLAETVQKPEEILAITFTKKATAEMRNRIITELSKDEKSPLAEQVIERDQKFDWNILNNPHRMRIQTIDSFCSTLTKSMPLTAAFGNMQNIAPSSELEHCYLEAARFLLSDLENAVPYNRSLQILLEYLDNNLLRTETRLADMLKKREQWLPHIAGKHNFSELREIMEATLREIVAKNTLNCQKMLTTNQISELTILARFADINMPETTYFNKDDTLNWQQVVKMLLTNKNTWRKKIDISIGFPQKNAGKTATEKALSAEMKKRLQTLLEVLSKNNDLLAKLIILRISPTPQYSDQQWAVILSLFELLKTLSAYLKMAFRNNATADHNEVALQALDALGTDDNPTDLTLALDCKIKHILVDEFQDTSTLQFKLLEKLTAGWQQNDGRTLFLVGDPMQSIYRFREAKVELFTRAQEQGIGYVKPTPLTLSCNFRSGEKIIEWVNHCFAAIMPQTTDSRIGAISYTPAIAVKDIYAKVKIWSLPDKDHQQQAQQVINIINAIREIDQKGSLAILVRSRHHLGEIINLIKTNNIPYHAVEIDKLAGNLLTQDLLTLTKALLNPANRVAWLSLLRCPICGLTLKDLHAISIVSTENTIYSALQNYQNIPNLTDSAKLRLSKLVNVVCSKLYNRQRTSLREHVEQTWLELAGDKCLLSQYDFDVATRYFNLLTEAETDEKTIDFTQFENRLKRLYVDKEPEVENCVQLMTIHKAKGLEFDHVIIPCLNRPPRNNKKHLLVWDEFDDNLLFAPLNTDTKNEPIYDYLCHVEQEKDRQELSRQLYVASTRAKQSLHLLACVDDKPKNGSLLEKLWPVWNAETVPPTVAQEAAEQQQPQNYLQRLPDNYFTGYTFAPSSPEQKLQIVSNNGYLIELPDITATNIGTIIHQLLARLAQTEANNWENIIASTQQYLWRNQLISMGTLDNLDSHLQFIESVLKKMLSDSRGRWILDKNHNDTCVEHPLTISYDGQIQHLIIDRTFTFDGTTWIIDYKTAPLSQQITVANYFQLHENGYRKQLKVYKKALEQITDNPIKTAIYLPQFTFWQEINIT